MIIRASFRLSSCICVWSMLCQQAQASGFAIFTHGATALGEGLATIAHGDNPNVLFFNPALMNQLKGTQLENGVTLIRPTREFTSGSTGATAKARSKVFFPGSFYLTHQYSDKLSAGIGVFNPFGLGSEWRADWDGRYIATKSEMTSFNINPAVSYRVSPGFSLAVGIDFLLVDASLQNRLNFSALGLADGNQRFDGDGTGFGFNLGLYKELNEDVSLGVSYRSEIDVDIKGDASFVLPSPALRSAFPNTSGRTDITFPQQLYAAIAYKGFDRLTLEAGIRWEGWSSYDQLAFTVDTAVNGATSIVSPKNWNDTLALTLGGRYRLKDGVYLLAGYTGGEDPIPNDTYDPVVTDSSFHAVTFGTELDYGRYKWAFAYSLQQWNDRNKANEVGGEFSVGTVSDARANGEYEARSHFIAISFVYKFQS